MTNAHKIIIESENKHVAELCMYNFLCLSDWVFVYTQQAQTMLGGHIWKETYQKC